LTAQLLSWRGHNLPITLPTQAALVEPEPNRVWTYASYDDSSAVAQAEKAASKRQCRPKQVV
jgi:hypothetical protein